MSNDAIKLRPYAANDSKQLNLVMQDAARADRVDPNSTLERIPTTKDLEGSSVLVAEDKATGKVLGYGAIRWWQEDDGTFVYLHSGTVAPSERKKGIGRALLDKLQEQAKQLSEQHPTSAPKVYGGNATETEIGANELFVSNGYTRVWSQVEMEFTDLASLEQLAAPNGFELKSVAGDSDIRAVYEANKQIYAGKFGSTPSSAEDYAEFSSDNPDTGLWKVLWHEGHVAGFVISRIDRDRAEIMEVSVMPQFRRRGLGKYLMIEAMRELKQRGVDIVRLHTDAAGGMGGRQLYEALGFKPLKEHYRYRKGMNELTSG